MKFPKLLAVLLATPLLYVACDKGPKADTPEGALEKYVQTAFGAKSVDDKQKMLDLSTGEAFEYLSQMSEDEFKSQIVEANLSLVGLKAKDLRQEADGDVSLVYELHFKGGKGAGSAVHTNKKIAYLKKFEDGWKIKATKNLKSFIEQKEDLIISPESTPQQDAAQKKESK